MAATKPSELERRMSFEPQLGQRSFTGFGRSCSSIRSSLIAVLPLRRLRIARWKNCDVFIWCFFTNQAITLKRPLAAVCMSLEIPQTVKRHKQFLVVAGVATTIGWVAYNGSQSFDIWLGKRQQIREVQEQNAILQRDNELRRQRIERLNQSSSERDMELRKLNLGKPGDMMFILPDGKSTPDRSDTATPAAPER